MQKQFTRKLFSYLTGPQCYVDLTDPGFVIKMKSTNLCYSSQNNVVHSGLEIFNSQLSLGTCTRQ